MENLIKKFESLKGAKFISINGYESVATKEIANHIVNVNISVYNAKLADFERLEQCKEIDLLKISISSGIAIDICKTALNELLISSAKNLSENKEDRTAQSKGQTNNYIFITPAIRLHKDTMNIHIFGQTIKKIVLVKGNYKIVKSNDKTLAKNAIKKYLELRSDKFRDFLVGNINNIKIDGETLERVK